LSAAKRSLSVIDAASPSGGLGADDDLRHHMLHSTWVSIAVLTRPPTLPGGEERQGPVVAPTGELF
jgi:hypothetical protein